jgi:hypothetical protein
LFVAGYYWGFKRHGNEKKKSEPKNLRFSGRGPAIRGGGGREGKGREVISTQHRITPL